MPYILTKASQQFLFIWLALQSNASIWKSLGIPTRSQRPHSEWITRTFLKSVNVLICWLLDPGKMPWYSTWAKYHGSWRFRINITHCVSTLEVLYLSIKTNKLELVLEISDIAILFMNFRFWFFLMKYFTNMEQNMNLTVISCIPCKYFNYALQQ